MSQIQVFGVTGGGGGPILTLTGNAGGPVSPAGGNINLVGGPGVTVTGNGGTHTLTITLSDVYPYTPVTHAMSPYIVLATDYYISVDCSAGDVIILLPNAPTLYKTWVIKDRLGPVGNHEIFIQSVNGLVLIDGVSPYDIMGDFDSINVIFNGVGYEIF